MDGYLTRAHYWMAVLGGFSSRGTPIHHPLLTIHSHKPTMTWGSPKCLEKPLHRLWSWFTIRVHDGETSISNDVIFLFARAPFPLRRLAFEKGRTMSSSQRLLDPVLFRSARDLPLKLLLKQTVGWECTKHDRSTMATRFDRKLLLVITNLSDFFVDKSWNYHRQFVIPHRVKPSVFPVITTQHQQLTIPGGVVVAVHKLFSFECESMSAKASDDVSACFHSDLWGWMQILSISWLGPSDDSRYRAVSLKLLIDLMMVYGCGYLQVDD